MSVQKTAVRLTVPSLRARKDGDPIVSLTAYDVETARLADPHCDMLLVGDSLGMVVYGLPSTLAVTLDMMAAHGAAVVRGSSHAVVGIDMPFGSYEQGPGQAFESAAWLMAQTGAQAVKLEGGVAMAETIRFLVRRGIPVIGHVGLTPQAVNVLGGFRVQGRSRDGWPAIEADAKAVAEAGAFSIVVEGVSEPLARRLTEIVDVPTIGIGASAGCDGQILVTEDMLGLTAKAPKFVRRFAGIGKSMDEAFAAYAQAVRDRTFPALEETYAETE
ncbi:MAG: 3-methyl-2-oxobutanoate hydroxymethyltransferase [Tepidamorphaceae bacterium]|nr:3-methyl-2-oxobutanoate hydroxymethyltransferase [Rhodobiaceae bacterium]MCC0049846.1 3-methyl-2-oxobutanoate hydroxymethyltransferase [Rhodobiaceae bacterium]